MGLVARVKSFARVVRNGAQIADVKVDLGGGDIRTVEQFGPAGDDSAPLPGDSAAVIDQSGTGRMSSVGYQDPNSTPKALQGEKRIYARDANGNVVAELWLQGDGSLAIDTDSDVNINGVIIKSNGDVEIPTSLKVAGKEIAGHDHAAGTPPGTTGPNN